MKNKKQKMNSLAPLSSLEKKPLYSGSTAIVKYVEGRKPKGIQQSLEEMEKNKTPDKPLEGRKKTEKRENKIKTIFTNLFIKTKNKKESNIKQDIENEKFLNLEGQEIISDNNKVDDVNIKAESKLKIKLPSFKKSTNNINYETLGYPKKVKIPVDVEILNNEKNMYFNVEKWLEYRKLSWITKIIPIHILDKLTYNRRILDNQAPKLHDEAILYNNMSPVEQYEFDKKIRNRKFMVAGGFIASIGLIVMLSIIPSYQSKSGISLLRSGEYQAAYQSYNSITNPSSLDKFYKQYSLAMGYAQAENYTKAKEELLKLEGYTADYVDLDESMNSILYQEAAKFYEEGKYADAANNLKITYNYKDSKARFLEASYMSLDELMKAQNYEEAMKMLSFVGNYKDASTKGKEFMEKLYQEAHEKYKLGLYAEAEKLFFYVAQNDYKDSRTMIYQSQYNAGLEFYKKKDYDKAIEQLSKIVWFKDSSAMLYDMYYTKGKALMDTKPSLAYDNFINCLTYRDTLSILQKPQLAVYGEWRVLTYNGSYVSDVNITFDGENKFTTNNEKSTFVKNISFSNNKPAPYTFDGSYFKTDNNNYKINVVSKDINNVALILENGDSREEITLTRISPVSKSNLDVFTSVRDSFYKYIDKKLENTEGSREKETQDAESKEKGGN